MEQLLSPQLYLTLLGTCVALLLLIAVIDARTSRIPVALLACLLLASGLLSYNAGSLDLGAVCAALGIFGGQWYISRGSAMGSGDVFLAIAISLLLGSWQNMLLAIIFSYAAGAIIASTLVWLGRKQRQDSIPFGPFLVLGTLLTLFYTNGFFVGFWAL